MSRKDLSNDEKKKSLDTTLGQIEKKFGKGSIMVLGDEPIEEIDVIPTGALNLDLALGVGGLPRGRVVEIYGPESSGKTTLALHCVAEAQKQGGLAAFIDAEHALDLQYAKRLGVDTDNLILSQPDYGEQALEIVESLVNSNALDIIIIDSVAALVPRAEIDGDMGDSHMGLLARLMSQALRKLSGIVAKSNTCVVFLNQIRQKIGIVFGNPETTPGGVALKFYSTIRLEVRRGQTIKENNEAIGSTTRVKVVKNKIAPPFKTVEFDIMYGTGISKSGTVLDLAAEMDIVEKAGSWYSYEGERLGQGKENVKGVLESKPSLLKEIEDKVRTQVNANTQNNDSEEDDLEDEE